MNSPSTQIRSDQGETGDDGPVVTFELPVHEDPSLQPLPSIASPNASTLYVPSQGTRSIRLATSSRSLLQTLDVAPGDTTVPGAQRSVQDDEYPEGGRGWWVVAGCAMLAGREYPSIQRWQLVWGVFQDFYSAQNLFPGTPDSILSLLGSLQGGMMLPTAFICGKLGDRFGYKPFVITGSIISFLGMLFAAFSRTLWQFFITQGIMSGLGTGFILPFIMSYPAFWFKRRRGLATGAVIAGSSLGGGVASLIVRAMLTRIGLRDTLLIYSFVHLVVLSTGCLLVKQRQLPTSRSETKRIVWVDMDLFRDPVFWSIAMCICFTCFGYLTPYFYISQYTQEMVPGLSDQLIALPVAVMNFSAAFGRTFVGRGADRIGVANAFLLSVTLSGLSQLLIWTFSFNYGAIMAFSVVYGFWGGCFISLTSVLGAKVYGIQNLATLSGILILFNLPGNMAGAPVAGGILSAAGGNWRPAIIFSGATQILGACTLLYARLKRQPRPFAIY